MYLQFDIDFSWYDFLWSDIFMNENDEYAFTVSTIDGYTQYGMTLRDYFAAKAMQSGILVGLGGKYFQGNNRLEIMKLLSETAYIQADAMLEARK
jgi:hypothetical protein